MYRSKLPKPDYSVRSLDKLCWSCFAWPIRSLETIYTTWIPTRNIHFLKKPCLLWGQISFAVIVVQQSLCKNPKSTFFLGKLSMATMNMTKKYNLQLIFIDCPWCPLTQDSSSNYLYCQYLGSILLWKLSKYLKEMRAIIKFVFNEQIQAVVLLVKLWRSCSSRLMRRLYSRFHKKTFVHKGSRNKKVLLLMAGPLRPNSPPPSSLMAVGKMERWKKSLQKK